MPAPRALALAMAALALALAGCRHAPLHRDGPRELEPNCWRVSKTQVRSACDCPPSGLRDELCPGLRAGADLFEGGIDRWYPIDPDQYLAMVAVGSHARGCAALVSPAADGCTIDSRFELHATHVLGTNDVNSSAVHQTFVHCGGFMDICGQHFACQCEQADGGSSPAPPGLVSHHGRATLCLPAFRDDAARAASAAAIPLECPSAQTGADGGLVCHGELAGAIREPLERCSVRTSWTDGGPLATTVFTLGPGALDRIEVAVPHTRPAPDVFPDSQIERADAHARTPDGREFALSRPARRAGYVELHETSATDHWFGDDGAWAEHPHGCLSARLDQELPDGGRGPGAVYVRLSF